MLAKVGLSMIKVKPRYEIHFYHRRRCFLFRKRFNIGHVRSPFRDEKSQGQNAEI